MRRVFSGTMGTGDENMENWKKDARRDVAITDIEALVPKNHLLRISVL